MTHHLLVIAFVCLASLFAPLQGQTTQDEKLRRELETIYNTWRQSMVRHNYEAWQLSTAAYRKMRVRNLAVSEKHPFPESLFNRKMTPASLTPLRFIGIIVKGPTAAATYFGKADWGIGGEPTEAALVLLFIKERSGWKYDQSRYFNLTRLPAAKERLRNRDSSVLEEQDGFQPLGAIPPVPPACPAPRYIAKIFADCPGRKVDIRINRISDHVFENESNAEVISGGLRDGSNTINITATPIPGSKDKGPAFVAVYIMPETEGNVPGKAYTFTIDEAQKDVVRESASFNVTPEVIRLMNPKNHPPAKR